MVKVGKVWLLGVLVGLAPINAGEGFFTKIHAWYHRNPIVCPAICTSIGVAGVGMVAYLMYMREESNEKLCGRAYRKYEDLFSKYFPLDAEKAQYFLNSFNEDELALLATQDCWYCLRGAQVDLTSLKDLERTIAERIKREAHKKNDETLRTMKNISVQMKKLISRLEQLDCFWQRYGNYFLGHKKIYQIMGHYDRFIQSQHNIASIKQAIMSQAARGSIQYPYFSFADELKANIAQVKQALATVRHYRDLSQKTEILLTELNFLFDSVVSFPEYTNELYVRKQHRLEQERLEIERQKMEAERQKAYVMSHQVEIERQKLHALHQQNHLLAKQLNQPERHIHINVQPASVREGYHRMSPEDSSPELANNGQNQSAAIQEVSSNMLIFFQAIENITASMLDRFDFHISQLEQQYGSARSVQAYGFSLLGAALSAKQLEIAHKVELIKRLKNYGVVPTAGDKKLAYDMKDERVIRAVCE